MKSPMVYQDFIPKDEREDYSKLQVLQSGGGWYVGTIYTDPETGFQEPGSRDTGYFANEKIATDVLTALETTGDTSALRKRP